MYKRYCFNVLIMAVNAMADDSYPIFLDIFLPQATCLFSHQLFTMNGTQK